MLNKKAKKKLSNEVGSIKINEWYQSEFPTDEVGAEINPEVSFSDAVDALNSNADIYETIGVADSIVRERIFEKLSKEMDVDYDFIYEKWLGVETRSIFLWT